LNPIGLTAAAGNYSLVARFQGTSAGIQEQLDRFAAIAAQQDLKVSTCRDRDEDDLWQQIQAIARPPVTDTNSVTCKFGLQPTAAVELLAKLNDFGAPGLVHLGSGVGRLAIAADPARVAEIREFCQRHGGYLTILAASKAFKAQVEPWGYVGNATEMMRRLKKQFDPQNLVSPGCFVGGL
ncbi:MAG: FAD-linked oxidase C-terminal domain-containing protein, partial [Cyanobacteria bacterium J06641_5]